MQRLIETKTVVPMDNENRHFRYRHIETGHWSHSAIYDELVTQYLKHRRANGLPIPDDYEAQIQDQLCDQLPPDWCERTRESWVSTRFGIEDFLHGMKAFARLMTGGEGFVDQREADRRARICANCYYDTNIPGCATCKKIADYVTGEVATRHTPYDDKLKACAVCHCSLLAKVHFPLKATENEDNTPERQALWPSFCWQKRGGVNFIAT